MEALSERDDIRDEDFRLDRDDPEPEEREPDDVIRQDNIERINEWLKRR